MRIAIISEVSSAEKNKYIVEALSGFGHEIINAGMKQAIGEPELNYIETGLLGAILLNTKCVDFVIGGCGTGQGFLNSIMQYPGISCGLIESPLDAFLFAKINGGNCISLPLNKGYGWAGDINLRFIFEKLFSTEIGSGYPEHRKIPQQESRIMLMEISKKVHLPFETIIKGVDSKVLEKVLKFPGVWNIIDSNPNNMLIIKAVLDDIYANF